MTPDTELRHLESGPRPGDQPLGLLIEIDATSSGQSRELLTKACDVMKAVVSNSQQWPSLLAWRRLLPTWFVEQSAPEETKEEAAVWLTRWRTLPPDEQARASTERAWSLADWLYWIEPTQRQWHWWDGGILDADTTRIVVEATETPTALGALEWLLRTAGAKHVAEANRDE